MNFKKALKYTGLTALTVACPPLGLATIAKRGNKKLSFFGGIAASVGIALCLGDSSSQMKTRVLYDSPKVEVKRFEKSAPSLFGQIMFAPLTVPFVNGEYKTVIYSPENTNLCQVINGQDILKLDDSGKYSPNFSPTNTFYAGREKVSLLESRVEVSEAKNDWAKARKSGNIFAMREQAKKISLAEEKYAVREMQYHWIANLLSTACSNMNAELSSSSYEIKSEVEKK